MGENCWLLKVEVVEGKKLVIRDFKTSDPYVVVKLGNQTAKTKVINNSLNPVWNQELSFSIKEPLDVLKLRIAERLNQSNRTTFIAICHSRDITLSIQEVLDKDLFKADDKMGFAFVSLQPLTLAAKVKNVIHASEAERFRTVLPDDDNCLVKESYVSSINGEMVQDVWLRLRAAESGEIQLKLKLLDHPSANHRSE